MKQRRFSLLAIAALLAFAASGAYATATLAFVLDGTLVLTCVDNAGCDSANGTTGLVSTTYTNGTVAIAIGTGTTKPAQTNPTMDLDDVTATLAAGHSLTIFFSEVGFTGIGGFTMIDGGSNTCSAGCTTTGTSWFDTTNTLFGLGTQIATTGAIGGGVINSTTSGAGPSTSPYSLTEAIILNNTRGTTSAFLSSDMSLTQTPEPTSVLLLGTLAALIGYSFRRKFSGNVA